MKIETYDGPAQEKGNRKMLKAMMKPRRIICVTLMILLVAGLCITDVMPGTVQPAEAQFGEIILAIQITLGAVNLVGDLFSLAKYFLGPNPSAEALEMLEDQTEELEEIIAQEDVILNDITQITDKLAQNALTETANSGIANIEARYGEMLQMAQLGYGNVPDSTMSIFSDNVMGPLNSIERCVEAFYQSLVIHPPGSPNCALEQARDVALDELAGVTSSSDFSATVESTNGVNIVAERPMYFNYGGRWNGGHDEASITSSGTRFHFAEGTRRPNFSTYLCIQNPEDRAAEVQITYLKGDGKSQVQRLTVPARSRRTVFCSETVTGPTLKNVFEANLMKLFASAWVYQMMGSQCVIFARDYKPDKYGTSDDYRNGYYKRYMAEEAEMFLQCTEQLVMSQVDVSSTSRSQKGIFNLPPDASAVLSQADELVRMATAEGTATQDPDGSYSKVNLGLCGRLIASRDILPAGGTPQQLRAKVHGGSTTYTASKTQLVSIPWESVNKTALLYDCWTGAAPYNTVSLENPWSLVRYRFNNLPAGSYDIIDSSGNVLSTGTVTTQQATAPQDPAETYQLTYGSFNPIVTTRGGPAILLNSSQWTGSKSTTGTLRNMTDPTYYHTVMDPATGGTGVWMYSNGGNHATTYTCNQDTVLERTITAGADITVYPHYALSPKQAYADGDARGSVSGNITILPTHYKATAAWELYVTDLATNTKTTIATDKISAEDDAGKYDQSDKFGYDSRTDVSDAYYVPFNMINGHQYKFTLKLSAHHYTDIHNNSNMWAKVNQQKVLNGLRLLGF